MAHGSGSIGRGHVTHHHHHGLSHSRSRRSNGGVLARHPRRSLGVLLIFMVPVAPIILQLIIYGPRGLTVSTRETRPVSMDAIFNNAIYLEMKGNSEPVPGNTSAFLYIFSEKPPLSPERDHIDINRSLNISHGDYEYWAFYLIPPADATVKIMANGPFDFYVFKGESKFRSWTKDESNNNSIAGYQMKNATFQNQSITLFDKNITAVDDYYFIVANPDRRARLRPVFSMTISRSLYNVSSGYSSVCSVGKSQRSCKGVLELFGSDIGIIRGANSSDPETNIQLTYWGEPLVEAYVVLVGGSLFLIFILMLSMSLCCRLKKRRVSQSTTSAISECTVSTVTSTPPTQQTSRLLSSGPTAATAQPEKETREVNTRVTYRDRRVTRTSQAMSGSGDSEPLLSPTHASSTSGQHASSVFPSAPPYERNAYTGETPLRHFQRYGALTPPPTYEEATT